MWAFLLKTSLKFQNNMLLEFPKKPPAFSGLLLDNQGYISEHLLKKSAIQVLLLQEVY